MKDVGFQLVSPKPPKLPPRPVSERVNSGLDVEDAMKVSVMSEERQVYPTERNTDKIVADQEADTSRGTGSPGYCEVWQETRQETTTVDTERSALQKRRVMIHLMLGDDDD
jgi:hypothetical protein